MTIAHLERWYEQQSWKPYPFQRTCWRAIRDGSSGLLNAPTGSGKTLAVFLGTILRTQHRPAGLRVLWITPLRALAADVAQAMQTACTELDTGWTVGVRTGDTSAHQKQRQRRQPPTVLVTTPESVHVLLSYKGAAEFFGNLDTIVVDEWHELIGSKRGVQTELALARLRTIRPTVALWGISATIGNLDEATQVLLGSAAASATIVRAPSRKAIEMTTIMPDHLERYPWAGHLGIRLLAQVEEIVRTARTTLVFTNTRSQAEIWYQQFLEAFPDYAGVMALHHGSLDNDVRTWVESATKDGKLKVVFCTSSLDLGVDFAPVDHVVQVGSPKGVARFLQRAGRSGHQPTAVSRIAFLPTHALEIAEGAAMRMAMQEGAMEDRSPVICPIDVLAQWLVTLACGDGFHAEQLLNEVRSTYAYASLHDDDWHWVLHFVRQGGTSLQAYPEFSKVEVLDTLHVVRNRSTALRHRLQIGTIMSEAALHVQFVRGKRLGTIEESFIAKLDPGDVFWFGGRCLEFVRGREMTARVTPASQQKGAIPRWVGGRMPLSSPMSAYLRRTLQEAAHGQYRTVEARRLQPLLDIQRERSHLPSEGEFLVELFQSKEGHHAFFYPFEGRLAHEGMAALLAMRLSDRRSITCSLAMNDYGFEVLSDQPLNLTSALVRELLDTSNLATDILRSANVAQIARRRFRSIARVAGLVFHGFPAKTKAAKHLQASSELFYDVFQNYDPTNRLLQQATNETLTYELDEDRIRQALERCRHQTIVLQPIDKPSPLAVPILVDRLREKVGSERTEDIIRKWIGAVA
ncbi:MAG: ligase-associated DNA damage response DEXH box helicase [Candidatus Kapaibacteriota bacterium]